MNTDLALRVAIVRLETRQAALADAITKKERRARAAYLRRRRALEKRVGWKNGRPVNKPGPRPLTGLRPGTVRDLCWNGMNIVDNCGWVVNHAGLRIVSGDIKVSTTKVPPPPRGVTSMVEPDDNNDDVGAPLFQDSDDDNDDEGSS